MRSTIVAAAFVAGAIAVPYQKRDVVVNTEIDVVYVTDVVTVTAGGEAPEATTLQHYGGGDNGHQWWTQWSQPEASPTAAPAKSPKPHHHHHHHTSPAPVTTQTTWAAPSSTEQPAPSSTGGSGGSGGLSPPDWNSYSDVAVYHHNIHRQNHSASNVEWDDNLASIAQTIAESCVYAHNTEAGGGGYGQNIAAGVEANNISAIITDLFYNGEVGWYDNLYNEAQPDMTNFEHWGHFSQIVWKGTSKVGCYTQTCDSLANVGGDVPPYFTVCNYSPAGNYANEYGDNVGEPKGEATAQWNAGKSS